MDVFIGLGLALLLGVLMCFNIYTLLVFISLVFSLITKEEDEELRKSIIFALKIVVITTPSLLYIEWIVAKELWRYL